MDTNVREQLIKLILNLEWRMFQKVKSSSPASCQSNYDAFCKVRGSIFLLWPIEILDAYLENLKFAFEKGRNLITEKYARMDNLIPPLSTNPLIDSIVEIETKWQKEMEKTYPKLYKQTCRKSINTNDGNNFSVYLRCELETYGDETIKQYYKWVQNGLASKRNFSIEALENLVIKGGFKNLDQAEQYFRES